MVCGWGTFLTQHKDLFHRRFLEISCCCTCVLLLGHPFPPFSFSSSAKCTHSSFLGLWSLGLCSWGVLVGLSYLTFWCCSTTRDEATGGASLSQQHLSSTAFPFGFHLVDPLCVDGFLSLQPWVVSFSQQASSLNLRPLQYRKTRRLFAPGNITLNHFGKCSVWMVHIPPQGYLFLCLVFPEKNALVGRLH